MQRRILIILLWGLIVASCGPAMVEDKQPQEKGPNLADSLMVYNQKFAEYEAQLIEDYIARYRLKMETSGTGLRYKILKSGVGNSVRKGQNVAIAYRMYLLTGDLMDEVSQSNPLKFVAGKGEVIAGLEEIVAQLGVGGKAKIIVPSHLAYGATGIPGEIPPRASLVFDLEIIDVQ